MNEEYYQKTIVLINKYKLGFLQNPGGGIFTSDFGDCQIPFMDFKDDYEILLQWLKDKGKEQCIS